MCGLVVFRIEKKLGVNEKFIEIRRRRWIIPGQGKGVCLQFGYLNGLDNCSRP